MRALTMSLSLSALVAACGSATAPAEPTPEAAGAEAAAPEANAHDAAGEAPVAEADAVEAPKPDADGWTTYGETVTLTDVTPVGELLDNPMPRVGDTLLVEGHVADVCQKAGCWMVVSDGARTMRVRMKDHAFSVAKDGSGATARVQGEVVAQGVDAETIAHFKSESAKPDAMPEANLPEDAEVTYELIASAVQFKR